MLKIQFDTRVVTSDPFQAFLEYAKTHSIEQILDQMREECVGTFMELHGFARTFKDVPEFKPFIEQINDVRFDIKPDGPQDDWYFNASRPGRKDDKILSTARIRKTLAQVKKSVPGDAYGPTPDYPISGKLESLRKKLNKLEHLLAIGYYALPIYYETHEPTKITDVDWNRPLEGQTLKGYVWHKLINRSCLPEEANAHKNVLRPLGLYTLVPGNRWVKAG